LTDPPEIRATTAKEGPAPTLAESWITTERSSSGLHAAWKTLSSRTMPVLEPLTNKLVIHILRQVVP